MDIFDYARHNEEVRALWAEVKNGTHRRIPMFVNCNPRVVLMDPRWNSEGTGFESYLAEPETMLGIQCRFAEYKALRLRGDMILGWEEHELSVYPDGQNIFEHLWFGGRAHFPQAGEPATVPVLTQENKQAFLKRAPVYMNAVMEKALEFERYFSGRQRAGFTYKGKPIAEVGRPGLGTDGPFTLCCCLGGTTEFCIDLYEDTGFAEELLRFVTEHTIGRIKALRRHYGLPPKSKGIYFADDSIALLSCEDYRRFVLPMHKWLVDELSEPDAPNTVHLCGDATRHFKLMAEALRVASFDTGFPVKHGELLRELGPEVAVSGGVHVQLLRDGTPDRVAEETRRILADVKPQGKRFTIRDANNLVPCTPLENLESMYNTVRTYGYFDGPS